MTAQTYDWNQRHERQANRIPVEDPSDAMRQHVRQLIERIDVDEAMRRCAVREAVRNALACTWRRRAAALEWARPRPGEYQGLASAAEVEARDEQLAEAALACRRKADMLEAGWLDE